jgi:hypothetical protein
MSWWSPNPAFDPGDELPTGKGEAFSSWLLWIAAIGARVILFGEASRTCPAVLNN